MSDTLVRLTNDQQEAVATRLTAEMFDPSVRFATSHPATWRVDLKEALPAVMRTLVRQAQVTRLEDVSDHWIGTFFGQTMTETTPEHRFNYVDRASLYGAWLREHYTAAVDALKAEAPIVYPEPPHDMRVAHTNTVARLQRWVRDGNNDLLGGVDDQAVYLQGHIIDGDAPWQDESCFRTGEAKDYLGRMMDLKRRLLGLDEAQPRTPQVGEVWRVNKRRPQSAILDTGDLVTVDTVDGRRIRVHKDGEPVAAWYVHPEDLDFVPAAVGDTVVEVQPDDEEEESAVAGLREQVRRLTAQVAQEHENHVANIAMIREVLVEEANNRNWCSEFDEVVDNRINPRLRGGVEMESRVEREREWEVSFDADVTLEINGIDFNGTVSSSISTEATNADDAESNVSGDWDSIRDQVFYAIGEVVRTRYITINDVDITEVDEA